MVTNKKFFEYKTEGIWQHFSREKCGLSTKCDICKTELKTNGGSTKGLHEHMKWLHGVSLLKFKTEDDSNETSQQLHSSTMRSNGCFREQW